MENKFPLMAMSIADFRQEVEKIVSELCIEKEKNNPLDLRNENFKLIPRTQVRRLLNVADPTLITWEKKGIIKSYRMGRRVYYNSDEVQAIILNNPSKLGQGGEALKK